MISFRFHIVSLAAIFMALALGIVLGTAFLNDATVNQLESSIKSVRAENGRLEGELGDWQRFGNDAEDALVAERLTGVRVLTIVPEGLSADVRDKMRSVLEKAGAVDAGTLTLDCVWGDETPPIDEMAAALGVVGPISIESVTDSAADKLAVDFAAGGGRTLPALIDANLVRLDGADPAATPGLPVRYLVIDDGAPVGLLEPLARALAAPERPTQLVVTDASADDAVGESLVGVMRRDPKGALFSTVDHVQNVHGRVAAVLALRDLDRGVIGDYGTDDSADRAAPAAA
jgi:hypothetical protein